MRKESNLTEIVIDVSTKWNIYFFAVTRVLLINDVLKILVLNVSVCVTYSKHRYNGTCHPFCKKLWKQINCILTSLIILLWNMSFFLVEQHGRNQISIFCHQSLMTRYVVVNFLTNWNILIIVADISSQVILMSICCLCNPHWQRLMTISRSRRVNIVLVPTFFKDLISS